MKAAAAIFLLAFMGVLAIASCDPEPQLLIDESLKVDATCKLPNPCDRVDCTKITKKPERIA